MTLPLDGAHNRLVSGFAAKRHLDLKEKVSVSHWIKEVSHSPDRKDEEKNTLVRSRQWIKTLVGSAWNIRGL